MIIGLFRPTDSQAHLLNKQVLPSNRMEAIMACNVQERWVCEENIARFEDQLKVATVEKQRDHLRGLIARERERHCRLPPEV
jgi:hypothetical protein